MEPKNIRSTYTSTKLQKKFAICLLFFLLTTTAGATEYIVSPCPSDQAGASINGEEVVLLEDTVIPYWQFLLWLALMQISSMLDLLFPAKLIFAILGYRVVEHSNALGNRKRKDIYAFIKDRPGAYIGEIANQMKLNRGTLRHHIKILEAENMIEAQCYHRKVRYFQNNSTYDEKEKRVISAFQNEMTRKILLNILKEECNTNMDLARTIGISRSTISWHMKQLKELDIIEENKEGKSMIYSINPVYRDTIEKTYVKFFE
ncbi:winged helix-turn-helix transcriptional regulator [Methanosarcina sp. KYL-1]|uniref:winged helix-turn-helix transcriptional regulator n=1 Tax=Methanosarcina sp. KYL-1 TaxID=2602068 RepID=UPI0021018D99